MPKLQQQRVHESLVYDKKRVADKMHTRFFCLKIKFLHKISL